MVFTSSTRAVKDEKICVNLCRNLRFDGEVSVDLATVAVAVIDVCEASRVYCRLTVVVVWVDVTDDSVVVVNVVLVSFADSVLVPIRFVSIGRCASSFGSNETVDGVVLSVKNVDEAAEEVSVHCGSEIEELEVYLELNYLPVLPIVCLRSDIN